MTTIKLSEQVELVITDEGYSTIRIDRDFGPQVNLTREETIALLHALEKHRIKLVPLEMRKILEVQHREARRVMREIGLYGPGTEEP